MIPHRRLMLALCIGAALALAPVSAQESARASGWIAIPVTEYQALRAKAYPAEAEPEAPPVQSTLTRIDYNLRIKGDFGGDAISVASEAFGSRGSQQDVKRKEASIANQVSSNVVNFQRRVSGDLPIQVDVPRSGNSYKFVRPLVINEETKVTFKYKSR